MQAYAPRPSEASIKIYERSESILAFAFLKSQKVFAKKLPQNRVKRGQKYELWQYIGAVFSVFPF